MDQYRRADWQIKRNLKQDLEDYPEDREPGILWRICVLVFSILGKILYKILCYTSKHTLGDLDPFSIRWRTSR